MSEHERCPQCGIDGEDTVELVPPIGKDVQAWGCVGCGHGWEVPLTLAWEAKARAIEEECEANRIVVIRTTWPPTTNELRGFVMTGSDEPSEALAALPDQDWDGLARWKAMGQGERDDLIDQWRDGKIEDYRLRYLIATIMA